jgi:hypothetical protein
LIISGHFLSIYDWLVAQTTKVIGAFKLFNSRGGSRGRQISRATEVKIAYLKKIDSSYL